LAQTSDFRGNKSAGAFLSPDPSLYPGILAQLVLFCRGPFQKRGAHCPLLSLQGIEFCSLSEAAAFSSVTLHEVALLFLVIPVLSPAYGQFFFRWIRITFFSASHS